MDDQTKISLRQAINEISYLRQENRVLKAVADTVRTFSLALIAYPPSEAMTPDIVWELEKAISKAEKTEAEKTDG